MTVSNRDFLVIGHLGVDERVRIACRYRAHVRISLKLEITLDSPFLAPAVLDTPKFDPVFNAVAGKNDCMVDVLGCGSTVR